MTEPIDIKFSVTGGRGPDLGGPMQFIEFIEYNEHEGEDWSFWLQVDGNEEAIEKLRKIIATGDDDGEQYELDDELTPESEVDILVKRTRSGYMDYENKVTGKFVCPDGFGEYLEDLKKGEIKKYFKDDASGEATPE